MGGTSLVSSEVFEGFDYVALGHLHRPQSAGRPEVRYSGSLLQYSFSEIADHKGVDLVELDERGAAHVERVNLPPRRPLLRIEGTLRDLCERPIPEARDAFLQVVLTDAGALLDPIGKLREVYPNILDLRRTFFAERAQPSPARRDSIRRGPVELFADFAREIEIGELDDEQREVIAGAFEAVQSRLERT
jgi:DNA repair protein SbcD/Mre11